MDKKYFVIVVAIIFVVAVIISSTLERKVNNSVVESNEKKITTTVKKSIVKENIMDGISLNYHASIRFSKDNKIIYFDPYKIEEELNDANYIFITHSHYDHYSESDIKKVMNNNTKFVITADLEDKIKSLGVNDDNFLVVYPNKEYKIDDISFETVPAYNTDKTFHKKSYNWVGYNVKIGDYKYYIVGDSDVTDELKNVSCDVIFIPVGGTYTMSDFEAAEVVNEMNVKYAVPIHYGIVGSRNNAEAFVGKLNDNIKGVILK